jgi:hypothetical protein
MDAKTPFLRERARVKDSDLRCPIAQKKFAAIGRQSPSFPRIGKAALHMEIVEGIDEPCLRFPGKLQHQVFEKRNSLAKKLRREVGPLDDLPCLQADFPKR